MKWLNIIVCALLIFFSSTCNTVEDKEKIPSKNNDEALLQIDSNEALVYTVPTPVQAASALNLLNINYSEDLISDTKNNETNYLKSSLRAINLGINLVDFSYVAIYNNNQLSLKYLNRVDKLTKELDLQNQATINLLSKCRNYIQEKDSISMSLLKLQNEMDKKLFDNNMEEVSVFILCGFYIEGSYLILENYDKLLKNKSFIRFSQNSMNNIILQQKIYIESIVELLDRFKSDESKMLSANFTRIKNNFDKLELKYEYDDKAKRLKKVTFNKAKLAEIRNDIVALKKAFVGNSIPVSK